MRVPSTKEAGTVFSNQVLSTSNLTLSLEATRRHIQTSCTYIVFAFTTWKMQITKEVNSKQGKWTASREWSFKVTAALSLVKQTICWSKYDVCCCNNTGMGQQLYRRLSSSLIAWGLEVWIQFHPWERHLFCIASYKCELSAVLFRGTFWW